MKKRVFLLTILFALVHFPFILEIIALYPKLGPRTTDNTDIEYSKLNELEHMIMIDIIIIYSVRRKMIDTYYSVCRKMPLAWMLVY